MNIIEGEYILQNEQDSINLAQTIAHNIKLNDILAFRGDLGAGKTFLCRQIIKELCGQETNVISPTFNLLQIYEKDDYSICHYDLYRLKDQRDIYELGFEDALNSNICLIEWPELIMNILPKNIIVIDIEIIDQNKRRVFIKNN